MSGIKRSRVRISKTCKQCNAEFSVANYRKDTALFCSRKCLGLSTRYQCTTVCAICQTEFTHIASRANKAKYCSQKCYNKAQNEKGTVQYECAHCHTVFLDSPSHKRKYCSRACINKASKERWNPAFSTVRNIMLKRNMLSHCNRCGYKEHPNILGVHHRDRNRRNNSLENLEVLCPNCHSLEHAKHVSHGFTE